MQLLGIAVSTGTERGLIETSFTGQEDAQPDQAVN